MDDTGWTTAPRWLSPVTLPTGFGAWRSGSPETRRALGRLLPDACDRDHRRLAEAKSLAGLTVRAREVVGPDSEDRPRILTGRLQVVYVKTLRYDRFSINGIGIDPLTIELVDE
jgi:hypothetical protein